MLIYINAFWIYLMMNKHIWMIKNEPFQISSFSSILIRININMHITVWKCFVFVFAIRLRILRIAIAIYFNWTARLNAQRNCCSWHILWQQLLYEWHSHTERVHKTWQTKCQILIRDLGKLHMRTPFVVPLPCSCILLA